MTFRSLLSAGVALLPALASAYNGPQFDLLSEVNLAGLDVDQSVLQSLPKDKLYVALDTLFLSPDTGIQVTCDQSGKFTLLFDKPEHVEGDMRLAEYMLQGPVLISKDFSGSCPLLAGQTLWGPTWSTPQDYIDADTTGVVVVQPIKITSISGNTLSFIGALKDYHSIMGYVDEDPVDGLEWLEPGHTPWDVVNHDDAYHEQPPTGGPSTGGSDDTDTESTPPSRWPFSFWSPGNRPGGRGGRSPSLEKRAVPIAIAMAGLVTALKTTGTGGLIVAGGLGTGLGGTATYYLGKLFGSW